MSVIEEVCTITAKGQTTVPKAIRQVLGVSYGGRITFRVEDGTVSVHAATDVGRRVRILPASQHSRPASKPAGLAAGKDDAASLSNETKISAPSQLPS